MNLILEKAILENYQETKSRPFSTYTQWFASIRLFIASEDNKYGTDEAYVIVVSKNYKKNSNLHIDMRQDSLDLLAVINEVNRRLITFKPVSGDDFFNNVGKYFIYDDLDEDE